jgi:hypothetical protein
MMGQGRTPRVQDRGDADVGAEVLGIGGEEGYFVTVCKGRPLVIPWGGA